MVAQHHGVRVARGGLSKHGCEIKHRFTRQRALGEVGVGLCHVVEKRRGGLRLGAADVAASTGASTVTHGEMAAEAACLAVCAPQHAAFDDRRRAETRPERNHHEIIHAPSGARSPLADQGHAGIVLDGQRQIQFLPRPGSQIQVRCVSELAVFREHARGRRVHETGKRHADSGAIAETQFQAVEQA